MKKTKNRSKKHEKILENYDEEKTKSLQKAMDKVIKKQETSEKLKKYNLNGDFLKKF